MAFAGKTKGLQAPRRRNHIGSGRELLRLVQLIAVPAAIDSGEDHTLYGLDAEGNVWSRYMGGTPGHPASMWLPVPMEIYHAPQY